MEVPVPAGVSPGQVFTYCLAGHGSVRLRAPDTIAPPSAGIGNPVRQMMLACVPEAGMGAVRGRHTDLDGNVFYEGAYSSNERLPPEVCYTDPRVVWLRGGYVPTNASDGEWLVPRVDEGEYARASAGALLEDPDAAWDFFLEHDGSVRRERVRGRQGRRRGNPWGTRKNEKRYMVWDSNGVAEKPDVHYPTPRASLRRNLTQLVDGDCPACTTYPPSRLALRWLPRMMRKQYMMLVNVTEAAARGDAVAAAALPCFNVSALMEGMSMEQRRNYNNGRLRHRYALRDARVTCAECGGAWNRTPFVLNEALNETLVETTFEWLVRRQLFLCAAEGDAAALGDLRDTLGCDLAARDADNYNSTALHAAAYTNKPAAVRLLCAWNASLEAVDERNWTALHWACEMGSVEAAAALIEGGADVNHAGGLGEHLTGCFTPLHWAAYVGCTALVRLLAGAGARLDPRDMRGQTPLHVAAIWAQAGACEALIELGADDLAEEPNGHTAAGLADECCVFYHFEHLRPESWKHTPLAMFPGPTAWKECAERIRRAAEERLARDRRRLELLSSGALGAKRPLEAPAGESAKRARE